MNKFIPVVITILISITLIYTSYLKRDIELNDDIKNKGVILGLLDGNKEFLAISLYSGEIISTISVDFEVKSIVPTPGGVAAFFVDKNAPIIRVFSTLEKDSFAQIETINFPELTKGENIEHISFSPTGEKLYVLTSSEVLEYSHKKFILEFVARKEIALGETPLISNSQGSRLYRGSLKGLDAFFARGIQFTETITFPNKSIGDLTNWKSTADRTILWGSNNSGIFWFNTQDNSIGSRVLDLNPDSLQTSDKYAWVLSKNGDTLYRFDNKRRNSSPKRIKLQSTSNLIGITDSDTLLAFSDYGYLVYENNKVLNSIQTERKVVLAIYAKVQEGGGFACF